MTVTPVLSPLVEADGATFRALLDCMARPGKPASLAHVDPRDGEWGAAMLVLRCLLDHEVSLAVASDDPYPAEQLLRRTGSRLAPVEDADFVLASPAEARAAVEAAKEGSLEYPDESATVVIACAAVGAGPLRLQLSGPGIRDRAVLRLAGLPAAPFAALAERNRVFPLGIDVVLAGSNGVIACLPRTTRIDMIDAGEKE